MKYKIILVVSVFIVTFNLTQQGGTIQHALPKVAQHIALPIIESRSLDASVTFVKAPPVKPSSNPTNPIAYGEYAAEQYGWTGYEWEDLYNLWERESGWQQWAYNYSSGACGIVQSLPCDKLGGDMSIKHQIDWGLSYIKNRPGYGDPARAWEHELEYGWY